MVLIMQKVKVKSFMDSSREHPGSCKELESFEKELIGLINKIEFKTVRDQFQSKLKSDISKVKCSKNLFVFADKTSNIYELSKDSYDKLLAENVTKTYKKAPAKLEDAVNSEAKYVTEKLKLADQVERLAKSPAYITLKDHKENFSTNPK